MMGVHQGSRAEDLRCRATFWGYSISVGIQREG